MIWWAKITLIPANRAGIINCLHDRPQKATRFSPFNMDPVRPHSMSAKNADSKSIAPSISTYRAGLLAVSGTN